MANGVIESDQEPDFAEVFVNEALQFWKRQSSDNEASVEVPAVDHIVEDETGFGPVCRLSNGSVLSLSFPRVTHERFVRWLGRRVLYWPSGIEFRRRISLISSRLKERRDLHRFWFDALRTAVVRCDPERECVVVVEQTTAASAANRAAILFEMPTLSIVFNDGDSVNDAELVKWLHNITVYSQPQSSRGKLVYLSPELHLPNDDLRNSVGANRDAALIMAADRSVILRCKRGGNVERLVTRCLSERNGGASIILDDQKGTSRSTFETLKAAGAVPWLLESDKSVVAGSVSPIQSDHIEKDTTDRSHSSPLCSPAEWLCHWTRARPGPWPDESADDYLDALIMGCASADHSSFAALLRIVEMEKLLSSQLSRGTVSFSAVPLSEFRGRRVYRRHLRRFDFEPWGIAIRRTALNSLGGRAVRYVTRGEDAGPADSAEYWFEHPATDSSETIDWTEEREWRVPGDVSLRDLNEDDVCVFVDSDDEAMQLRRFARWPVVTVPLR